MTPPRDADSESTGGGGTEKVLSVAERLFMMENKIEESKWGSPRSSGFTTPLSVK